MQFAARTSLSLATGAKTRFVLAASTSQAGQLIEVGVSFNQKPSVTSTEPVLIELIAGEAKNGAEEPVTELTTTQVRGSGVAIGAGTASLIKAFQEIKTGAAFTSPRTLKSWYCSGTAGLIYQAPLGREIEIPPISKWGLALVINTPETLTANIYMEWVQGPS